MAISSGLRAKEEAQEVVRQEMKSVRSFWRSNDGGIPSNMPDVMKAERT